MARLATGDTVKVNTEITKENDQIIRDYQIAKVKRFGPKVTKAEALEDIIGMGNITAKTQIDTWSKELENFKNQK